MKLLKQRKVIFLCFITLILLLLISLRQYQHNAALAYVEAQACGQNSDAQTSTPIPCTNKSDFNNTYTYSLKPKDLGFVEHFTYTSQFGVDCFAQTQYSGDIFSTPFTKKTYDLTTKYVGGEGGAC